MRALPAPRAPARAAHPLAASIHRRTPVPTARLPPTHAAPDERAADADGSVGPSTEDGEGLLGKASAFIESALNFESWAPRSSRVWRLQMPPRGAEAADERDEAWLDSLNARLAAAAAAGQTADVEEEVAVAREEASVLVTASTDDDDLASSLAARLAGGPAPGVEPSSPLDGAELVALTEAKYGRRYDLSIVRRELAGIPIVALNVMWTYQGQRSFGYTADQFEAKLEGVAAFLNAAGSAALVRSFFAEPPRSKRGLPGRPVVGNAVSLRLQVDPAIVSEWLDG